MVNSAHRRRRGPVTRRAGRVVLHCIFIVKSRPGDYPMNEISSQGVQKRIDFTGLGCSVVAKIATTQLEGA